MIYYIFLLFLNTINAIPELLAHHEKKQVEFSEEIYLFDKPLEGFCCSKFIMAKISSNTTHPKCAGKFFYLATFSQDQITKDYIFQHFKDFPEGEIIIEPDQEISLENCYILPTSHYDKNTKHLFFEFIRCSEEEKNQIIKTELSKLFS